MLFRANVWYSGQVDLGHPLRSVVPSLDGPVLEVLNSTTAPMSARRVAHLVGRSPSGVNTVLARLAKHGLVTGTEQGPSILYQANRDNLAWPSIEAILAIRKTLLSRIAAAAEEWPAQPESLSVFGSFARGEAGADSDIDLLLVIPDNANRELYADLADSLSDSVERWTGNAAQIYTVDPALLTAHITADEPIVAEWRRDSITLTGRDIRDYIGGDRGKASRMRTIRSDKSTEAIARIS